MQGYRSRGFALSMYESTKIPGWSRALAIIFGLFIIGVGFTAIFFPAIVVGFITVLFSIAFIMMGLWALSMGISGQRVSVMRNPNASVSSTRQQVSNSDSDQKVPSQ